MRKWATLLVLCAIATPALAAKMLSIEQTEGLLYKLKGKPDGKVAAELDQVQLTERMSPARLAHWESEFPGARAHEEMMRLADLSAFQNPPVDDVLRDPEPDANTQVQILTLAAKYVRATIARLPDFFATRDTTHFESFVSQHMDYSVGSPGAGGIEEHPSISSLSIRQAGIDSTTQIEALHSAGQFSATVTYRDGHEVPDVAKKEKKEPRIGLTSSGEFGPVLAVVLGDALQSKISWLRWEQGASEPEAVFQFTVPENKSHFSVSITERDQTVAVVPAYHGEIEIDPATGEILRLSEIADMTPPRQDMRAAIMVEFAPVTISGRTYVCPVRSVAFSRFPDPNAAQGPVMPMQTELNDVAFTNYHELRSDMRILANDGSAPAASATPAETAANAPALSAPSPPADATPASNASPAAAQPAGTPASNPAPASTPASPPAPAAPAEASAPPPADSAPAPAESAASAAPADTTAGARPSGTVLQSNSKLVLVDVVVTHRDRPVEGLSRDRFHIYEDGQEQPIASFEEFSPAAKVTVAEPPTLPPDTYSNAPTYPDSGAVNVLLLDALNTPAGDQEQVRRAMIGYLGAIKPGTPMAVFTLSSRLRMAAGFTTDVSRLLKVFQSQQAKPKSAAGVGSGGSSLATGLEQEASGINTNGDPGTIWLATLIMQFAADTRAYDLGQRVALTLEAFNQLARYLAAIPGRKNVIWFSGSFPVDLGSAAMAPLAAARVAVYPVDARGLMTAPTAGAAYVPPPAFPSPGNPMQGDAADTAVSRQNKAFGVQTTQEKDLMKEIAAETGGQVFSTGNDLKAALDKIMANDSYYYALSYVPPEGKRGAQGAPFHTIEVKVDGGYQLAYRRGYYEDEAAAPYAGNGGSTPAPMLAAAVLGAPPATQILFEARVLPESKAQPTPPANGPALAAGPASATPGASGAGAKGEVHPYSVDLSVDPRSLTFTEGADGSRRSRAECAAVAYDGDGKELTSFSRIFDVNLPKAKWAQFEAAGTPAVSLPLKLDLPPAAAVVRIVVYDTASARTGSLEIPVEVSAGTGP